MPETDDASIDTSVTTAEDPFIILAITDRSRAIGDQPHENFLGRQV